MLQSSNHYLRPDYLAAPTAIDTKSSPLALLAQTCSAIGADTTNPKLLAANIEKATKSTHKTAPSLDCRDKCSPVSSHSSSVSTGSAEHQQVKSSFKPYESNNNHIRDRLESDSEHAAKSVNSQSSHRVKTPKIQNTNVNHNNNNTSTIPNNNSYNISNSNGGFQQSSQSRCDSNQSTTSPRGDSPSVTGQRRTPSSASTIGAIDLQQRVAVSPLQRSPPKESPTAVGTSAPRSATSPNVGTGGGGSGSGTSTRLHSGADMTLAAASKEANYVKALHAAAAAAGGMPSGSNNSNPAATAAGNVAAAPYYPGYVGAASSMSYPMDLMTASALMPPHHPMFKAAALNPYLNYARLKGLEMTPNICRDPYCTGCPSSPHFLNKAAGQACPNGCPHCERETVGKSGLAGSNSSAAAAAASAASSYHAQLVALAAASQMPYVCSWIGGDASYCGKRFATSDELFQHLRTHTASMPDSVLTAAAVGGMQPNHPLFQRTYPTPPLSPLSAARYHPYGKPSMLPPSLAPPPGSLASLPMPPHPAFAQYFSPYSLYGGPRLGSSHP